VIRRVYSNRPSFREVTLIEGMNVVLADRTKESTRKDSRNGLGKSTLIEIIHFCLGGTASKGKGILVEPLEGWTFSLDMTLGGDTVTVTRGVDHPSRVYCDPCVPSWPVAPSARDADGRPYYRVGEWRELLGALMFGLPVEDTGRKYRPTFRSLVSHFIRHGKGAFLSPFEHFEKQREWVKQVGNAFLLGLAWEDASDWQVLKDKGKLLNNLKKAAQAGLMPGLVGSLGELEAAKVRLESTAANQKQSLDSFRVHPQYADIERRANELTEEIHALANARVSDSRLLRFYEASGRDEHPPSGTDVARLYREAGVVLPGVVHQRLEDVTAFHGTLIANRRRFLSAEVERLKDAISRRDAAIERGSEERASLMSILQTHRALEEYTALQGLHAKTLGKLKGIETRIESLKKFEEGKSSLRIETEMLLKRARADYDERRSIRERAIVAFNANSQALYQAPGMLVIDIGPSGYRFGVEIERSESQGIGSMKVLCYDVMLAQLWSGRDPSPGVLVHDSTIFDGVDERQVAHALELAASQSERHGFQYLCALNSDSIPWGEFSPEFDLDSHVRLTLTDATPDGGLLGIRF